MNILCICYLHCHLFIIHIFLKLQRDFAKVVIFRQKWLFFTISWFLNYFFCFVLINKKETVAKLKEFCDSLVGLYKNSTDRIKRTQFRNFHHHKNFHIKYDKINHKKWLILFVLFALCGLCILLQPL